MQVWSSFQRFFVLVAHWKYLESLKQYWCLGSIPRDSVLIGLGCDLPTVSSRVSPGGSNELSRLRTKTIEPLMQKRCMSDLQSQGTRTKWELPIHWVCQSFKRKENPSAFLSCTHIYSHFWWSWPLDGCGDSSWWDLRPLLSECLQCIWWKMLASTPLLALRLCLIWSSGLGPSKSCVCVCKRGQHMLQ